KSETQGQAHASIVSISMPALASFFRGVLPANSFVAKMPLPVELRPESIGLHLCRPRRRLPRKKWEQLATEDAAVPTAPGTAGSGTPDAGKAVLSREALKPSMTKPEDEPKPRPQSGSGKQKTEATETVAKLKRSNQTQRSASVMPKSSSVTRALTLLLMTACAQACSPKAVKSVFVGRAAAQAQHQAKKAKYLAGETQPLGQKLGLSRGGVIMENVG
uniref:60S ribosomal protein L6 n=1 Tax=Macrostomum lignano TaxID=282301 RepID=A0A1I8FAP3_9PLAT